MEEYIRNEINKNNGLISFRDFMEMALYAPNIGYYQRNRERTGKEGDFFTSPNVSKLYGYVIGDYLCRMWETLEKPELFTVVEFGAGKGQLASAILDRIETAYQELYQQMQYSIVEKSDNFRKVQRELLQGKPVQWIDSLPDGNNDSFKGCILSNELIDAFPVHWVQMKDGLLYEKFVAFDEEKAEWLLIDQHAEESLVEYFKEQDITLLEGQHAEVNLQAKDWLQQCVKALDKGYILTIDYGYLKDELYAEHRRNGTLLCYYQHKTNDKPLERVGEQDITSHVNFSQLISWGEQLGLTTISYSNQQQFLMAGGITNYLQPHASGNPFSPEFKNNSAIKQLIMPGGMGDIFKVLLQGKNVNLLESNFKSMNIQHKIT